MPRNHDETLAPESSVRNLVDLRWRRLERRLDGIERAPRAAAAARQIVRCMANAAALNLPYGDLIPPADVLVEKFSIDLETAQQLRSAALEGEG